LSVFGTPKEVISAAPGAKEPNLPPEDREILDFVIERTKRLYWNDFISLVYSTYPIRTRPRYSDLDLVRLADEYTGRTL
jgi:hypothetical protein